MLKLNEIIKTLGNKNSFLSHVVTLTSGTVIAQFITIAASPVLTRLYSPEDMGVLASFMAVAMILGIVASGRYDAAIVLPKKESDATAVAFLGIIIAVFLGILVSIVFGIFRDSLAPILGMQHIPRSFLSLTGLVVFLTGLEQVLKRLSIRGRKFKVLASTQVTQQLGANGVKIGLGFLNAGAGGLFIGTIFGHLLRCGKLVWSERGRFFNRSAVPSLQTILHMGKKYKKFPLFSSWSTLLNTASSQIPVILFATLFSPAVAGYYALSNRILNLPMVLIGRSVSDVFIEKAARTRNEPDELRRITTTIFNKLLLISSICMSFMTFYGNRVFPLVFGDNWLEAGKYAQWLSLYIIFQFSFSPISVLFSVLERQGEGFIWNGFLFITRVLSILIAFKYIENAVQVIACFAVTGMVVYFLICIRILYLVNIRIKQIVFMIIKNVLCVFAIQSIVYYLFSLLFNRLF